MRFFSVRSTIALCLILIVVVLLLARAFGSASTSPPVTGDPGAPTAARPVLPSTSLSQATGAAQVRATAPASGALPMLSINDSKLTEGEAGITVITFTVTLVPASAQTVSVGYASGDGSATVADGDYAPVSGTLTFAPGETRKPVAVQVRGDQRAEPDEVFSVTLSSATHAAIGNATGIATIANDDAPPAVASAPTATAAPTTPSATAASTAQPAAPSASVLTAQPAAPSATAAPRATSSPTATPAPVSRTVYLPLVVRPGPPDLMIESIQLAPDSRTLLAGAPVEVRVTIRNIGTGSTAIPFWVDLYLNPARAPQANDVWNTLCNLSPCKGVAWRVTQSLAPGERLVLTTIAPEYKHTTWDGWLPRGTTTIDAYVDSWSQSGTTGALAERDEQNNRAEISGLNVTGTNPPSVEGPPGAMPAR